MTYDSFGNSFLSASRDMSTVYELKMIIEKKNQIDRYLFNDILRARGNSPSNALNFQRRI